MIAAMKTSFCLLLLLLPFTRVNGQCDNGDIRITRVNETELTEYLEMCNDTVWLTLCGTVDGWSPDTAAVACRQLGYSAMGAQGYLTGEDVESGLVPMCLGNEMRIEECPLTVGSGGKVNVICQPLAPDVFNLTLCFSLSDMGTYSEASTMTATYLASVVQDNCSCAYSPEYVTVSPVHCNQTTSLRVTLTYNSHLYEAIEALQTSGTLQDIPGETDPVECLTQCTEFDLSHTPSAKTSFVVTHTQLPDDVSTVVTYTETPSTKEDEIPTTSIFNGIALTPTPTPNANDNNKVFLTTLAAAVIGGSIALVMIGLVVIGVLIAIVKTKWSSIGKLKKKLKGRDASSPRRKRQKHVNYYDEIEEVDTVHTSLFPSSIGGSMFSIVRDKQSHSPKEVAHGYASVTLYDSLAKKPTTASSAHIYDCIDDVPVVPHDETHTEPDNGNDAKASRIHPYRVSTIIKEPLLTNHSSPSPTNHSSPSPTNHSSPSPSEGYSSLDHKYTPYATLEPFVQNQTEDLAIDNGYSHLVH